MHPYETQLFGALFCFNLAMTALILLPYTRRMLFRYYRRFMGKKTRREAQVKASLLTGVFVGLALFAVGFGGAVLMEIAMLTILLTYLSSTAPFFKR